ncbi:hypothetical protein IFM89_021200 [Coptis chinensis]|uniref:DUF8039 domain-containing protein n=1 Tax=Coptis chinensis TaxID=261450 RepID=A0A835LJB1_9MAGN|nr:hypothetical protein IFM89_021200 [Coptis chinensis]
MESPPHDLRRLIKRGSKKHVHALESKAREEEEKRKKEEQKRKKAEEKGKEERKKRKELKNKYKELEAKFNDRLTSPASEKIASNSHKSDNRDHIPPLGGAHSKRKGQTTHAYQLIRFWKVKIVALPIPVRDKLVILKDALGSQVACPKHLVVDSIEELSCSLAVGSKSNIVGKSEVYVELGPETKLHNVPLGPNNARVSVYKILGGKDHVALPIPFRDELVILKDALGSQVAWPKHLVLKGIETKKANSPIPAKNSKKENAEVTSRAPVRNHTLDLGKLGQYNSHVAVGKILKGKEQALLPVPIGDKLKFVEDAIGSHVAWPRELVVKANQDQGNDQDQLEFDSFAKPSYTAHTYYHSL